MRAGAARPELSRITGPAGTSEAGGSGPRSGSTRAQTSVRESASQRGSVEAVRFRPPASRRASPVATSPTHSSTPSGRTLVKEKREPSGDNWKLMIRAPSGRPEIRCSARSARRSSRSPVR